MEPGHVRLITPAPAYCSACFGAKPDMQHVDMGAAWDGPVVPSLENVVGVVGHTIDDLVICQECIERAGELVGLTRNTALQDEVKLLEEANAELHKRIDALTDQAGAVERVRAALLAGGTPAFPVSSPTSPTTGPPKIAPGPPPGGRGRQRGKRAAKKPAEVNG